MWDFLSFNHFITQDVLVVLYYIGAIFLPLILYIFKDYLIEHISFVQKINDKIHQFYRSFSSNGKVVFWILIIVLFLFMELFWRMMFEAMIGYFDMHEYLYKIANKLN